jgi:general transcription factor 3C polypeptide 5 (transcription factor C subunit 1)
MSSDSPTAQQHPLPTVHYYSVEYPGYVRNESTSIAVRNLGGERMLSDAFKRATTKQECIVEAKLRPDDVFSHPIHGDMVPTNNIVLKVTKRKRRRRAEGEGSTTHIGEYKVEAAGLVEKTVRFRSEQNDPLSFSVLICVTRHRRFPVQSAQR